MNTARTAVSHLKPLENQKKKTIQDQVFDQDFPQEQEKLYQQKIYQHNNKVIKHTRNRLTHGIQNDRKIKITAWTKW